MNTKFKMWSLYPFISRDISVWMPARNASHNDAGGPAGDSADSLKKLLKENGTDLLIKEPELVDSFTKGDQTSNAFRLVFQSYDRTLTDVEINDIMSTINNKIIEHKDWQVR